MEDDLVQDKTGFNFTIVPNELLFSQELTDAEKLTWMLLKSFAWGRKDECFPLRKTLAEARGVSTWQISRSLRRLVNNGWLRIKRRGLGKSNVYELLNPLNGSLNACVSTEKAKSAPLDVRKTAPLDVAKSARRNIQLESDKKKAVEDLRMLFQHLHTKRFQKPYPEVKGRDRKRLNEALETQSQEDLEKYMYVYFGTSLEGRGYSVPNFVYQLPRLIQETPKFFADAQEQLETEKLKKEQREHIEGMKKEGERDGGKARRQFFETLQD
jgi:hypothetical protein